MDLDQLFAGDLQPEITVVEGVTVKAVPQGAGQVDSAMPISLWPAAIALGRHLALEDFGGRRTIELGAGTGFLSLFLMKRGVLASPLITDCSPSSLSIITDNLALNSLAATVQSLDWSNCPPALTQSFDLVLGSDVIYSADALAPLFRTTKSLLSHTGTAFIANQKHRVWKFADRIDALVSDLELTVKREDIEGEVELLTLTVAE